MHRRLFLATFGAFALMARRLTPDPLQVDPYTNPVRISFPTLYRYFAIQIGAEGEQFNPRPISTVSGQDECNLPGAFDAPSYITDYVNSRINFITSAKVIFARRAPLGAGATPEEETDLWEELESPRTDTSFGFKNFNPQDPSQSQFVINTASKDAGEGDPSCIGVAQGGFSLFAYAFYGNFVTYLPDYDPVISGRFEVPAISADAQALVKHEFPKNGGQYFRNGEPVCCNSEINKIIHVAETGDNAAVWELNYDKNQGTADTVIVTEGGLEIPVKLVAWCDTSAAYQGDDQGPAWIFERTDIDFGDEDNGGS